MKWWVGQREERRWGRGCPHTPIFTGLVSSGGKPDQGVTVRRGGNSSISVGLFSGCRRFSTRSFGARFSFWKGACFGLLGRVFFCTGFFILCRSSSTGHRRGRLGPGTEAGRGSRAAIVGWVWNGTAQGQNHICGTFGLTEMVWSNAEELGMVGRVDETETSDSFFGEGVFLFYKRSRNYWGRDWTLDCR